MTAWTRIPGALLGLALLGGTALAGMTGPSSATMHQAAAQRATVHGATMQGATVQRATVQQTPPQRTEENPPPVSAQGLLSALHLSANPAAELVFLVDLSDSMAASEGGLYPYVQDQLPDYLQTLAQEEPDDQVAVITFGNPHTAKVIYGPAAPTPYIGLPADAHEGTTDFGQAFALALDLLATPAPGVQAGGVVLLSDGGMSAPADPLYDGGKGYSAPGWAQLRARAAGLPIPVTGYAVPLTTNPEYIANQKTALNTVFSSVETLPGGTTDLSGELGVLRQQVIYGEVSQTVATDSGQGVRVTWSGLPGTGTAGPAAGPLNLTERGHRTIDVTFTSLASKVPLYVTDLRADSLGGVDVTVSGLPGVVALKPGQQVTVPVTLSWQPKTVGSSLSGGTRPVSGQLQLAGTVGSTWTQTLKTAFDDLNFSPGVLRGNAARLTADAAVTENSRERLLAEIGLAVAFILAVGLLWQVILLGSLTLTTADGEIKHVTLWLLPVLRFRTKPVIGHHGSMVVSVRPFRRKRMAVKLRLTGMPSHKVRLGRGGKAMAAGVEIVHYQPFKRRTGQGTAAAKSAVRL